ncbi:MAG: flagellar export protein FliJ [Treponema sp.]|nr:flagellar export protein FliJ [Treponema sp.]
MRPFTFHLQKFLDVRKHYEDEAKIELGRATAVLSGLEQRLLELGRERARAAAGQYSPENSAVTIQQYTLYILRLDNEKERLLKEAAIAELKVEEARQAFTEASRERKVLDKLKEKRQKEHRKETLAREAKALDEVRRGRVGG